MKTYTIQTNRKTISYGTAKFEVIANSEEEALNEFNYGHCNEVDDFINASESEDTEPQIIHISKDEPNLLDHIN